MIAIPTYPYDPHSVWNRNQLGALDSSSVGLLLAGAVTTYVVLQMLGKGGLSLKTFGL